MASCFCFSKKAFLRGLRAETPKPVQQKVPPEVTDRIESVAMTADNSVYNLAKSGKHEELKRLLKSAEDDRIARWVTWVDDSNRTALIIATKEGRTDCIKLLIEYGSDIMHMSCRKDEGTALHVAAKKKLSPRSIYCLLSKGANPFVENAFRITPWDLAKQNSNYTAVNIFSNYGLFRKTLPMQVGSENETASTRDVCIFPRFEWNNDRKELRKIGRTLYFCSLGPSEDHSDVDLEDAQAEYIQEETTNIATVLLTFPASRARLARYLVARVRSTSALMHIWIPRWASWSLQDFTNIVNQKDESRRINPYRGSSQDDLDKRIINWIRQQTASQCYDDRDDGPTVQAPLPDEVYKRSQCGDSESLELLLTSLSATDKIRAMNWEDMDGNTPLMVSTEKNHLECVELLLMHGANVYHCSQKEHGGTALHVAVANGASEDVVQALLSYHANPLVENASRVTASDLCGHARDLMLREELLFREVMTGYISVEGLDINMGGTSDYLVFIAPRFACCYRPQDLHRISKTLHVYTATACDPLVEIDLYEASATALSRSASSQNQILLRFPRKAMLTCNWARDDYMNCADVVEVLMSFDSTVDSCSRFITIINYEDGLQLDPSIKNIWKKSRHSKGTSNASAVSASQVVSAFCSAVTQKDSTSVSDIHCQTRTAVVDSDEGEV